MPFSLPGGKDDQGKQSGRILGESKKMAWLTRLWAQEPVAAACVISATAIYVEYALLPALNIVTPPLVLLLMAGLIFRSRSALSDSRSNQNQTLTLGRLILFAAAHATFVFIIAGAKLISPADHSVLRSCFKYFVLAPTFLLLPLNAWTGFARKHRAECTAAILALLSFYPHRIFTLAWPWYSQAIGHSVYSISRFFVPALVYLPHPDPKMLGPLLNVTILFGCSGLRALGVFQIVFTLIIVTDWNILNRRRALQAYFAGIGIILAANVVRIAAVVILGNHFAPDLVARYHLPAGWVYFGFVLAAFIWLTYGWMTETRAVATPAQELEELPATESGSPA